MPGHGWVPINSTHGEDQRGESSLLGNTVVLTTIPNYETRFHVSGFGLSPGNYELYMEWCVSGGVGYIRYRYFLVLLNA